MNPSPSPSVDAGSRSASELKPALPACLPDPWHLSPGNCQAAARSRRLGVRAGVGVTKTSRRPFPTPGEDGARSGLSQSTALVTGNATGFRSFSLPSANATGRPIGPLTTAFTTGGAAAQALRFSRPARPTPAQVLGFQDHPARLTYGQRTRPSCSVRHCLTPVWRTP